MCCCGTRISCFRRDPADRSRQPSMHWRADFPDPPGAWHEKNRASFPRLIASTCQGRAWISSRRCACFWLLIMIVSVSPSSVVLLETQPGASSLAHGVPGPAVRRQKVSLWDAVVGAFELDVNVALPLSVPTFHRDLH